jgi:DNA-binding transcriptional LysR family regulator
VPKKWMHRILKNPDLFNNTLIQQNCYAIMNTKTAPTRVAERQAFDWGLMQSFLAALEAGSLLGAAKRTGQTQPTLGRQIAQLESQLGVVLFERTGRGLAPTEAAHRLAEGARAMQTGAQQVRAALDEASGSLAGTVRITASRTMAYALLFDCVAVVRAALPEVAIDVLASDEVHNLLQREADIAVRMVEPDQMTTIASRVGVLALGAFAHERYLARRGTPQSPADFLQHDLIGHLANREVEQGFAAYGIELPARAIAVRTDDYLTQWCAVRAGLGIGFVSVLLAKRDANVRQVMPETPLPGPTIWLVTHREMRTNPRIKAVYELLGEELRRRLV